MCPSGLCALGKGGYEYAYGDMGPATIYCVGRDQACLKGQTSPVNPPLNTFFGIGIAINLGKTTPLTPLQLTGSGLTVKLSNVPAGGARVFVTASGVDYCAAISTNPINIPWVNFNTKCYDTPPDGVPLSAAPATTRIAVQAVSDANMNKIDFCVETLSWQ
jgi:hypothetical protein